MKRIIAEKLVMTASIAGVGVLMVYLGSARGVGAWLTFLGLLTIALSPVISYLAMITRIKRMVSERRDSGDDNAR